MKYVFRFTDNRRLNRGIYLAVNVQVRWITERNVIFPDWRRKMRKIQHQTVWFPLYIVFLLVLSGNALAQNKDQTDIGIRNAIIRELSTDKAINEHLIDVSVDNGIVTFSGKIDNLLSKDRLEKNCFGIVGVRGIVNHVDVQPVLRSAGEIRNDLNAALFGDILIKLEDLTYKVRKDTVILNGSVPTIAEKRQAAEVAKGVKGVSYLKNDIFVVPKEKRSDKEIREEITGLLESDPFVYEKTIKISVKKGAVRLSGTVGSYGEKIFAGLDTYVSGATAIDDDNLKIELQETNPLRNDGKYVIKPDNVIISDIKNLLKRNLRTAPYDISVKMDKSTVTLGGTVGTIRAKKQAMKTALNFSGVYQVKNNIKVRPGKIISDNELERIIKQDLKRDPILERHDFTVYVRNAKAFIYGYVDNIYERMHVSQIVEKVPGVASIGNGTEVLQSQLPWTHFSDALIRENIMNEYRSLYLIDLSDLNITVDDGVATVTGNIESTAELHEIIKHALDAGAKMVVTRLLFNGMEQYGAYDYRDRYDFD